MHRQARHRRRRLGRSYNLLNRVEHALIGYAVWLHNNCCLEITPAWKAFDAERDKAQKTTTRFVVEVEK